MPKKYHIDVKQTSLKEEFVPKFRLERGENCINCGKCAKVCIYHVHKRREDDPRIMADPISSECRNCFRCIQECPRGALVKSITPEFKALGGAYWKPEMILSIWKQAGDGKVPVSGAGYRGPFTGPFFDSMWTDMSEIVRPTRDGIHGREYINTSVDIGRKLNHLAFDGSGKLLSDVPKTIDIPIPIIFDPMLNNPGEKLKIMTAAAAAKLNTFAIFPAEEISQSIREYSGSIVPLVSQESIEKNSKLIKNSRIVEIQYTDGLLDNFPEIKNEIKNLSDALVAVRIPAAGGVESKVLDLVKSGAEVIHLAADYRGMETNQENPRFIKDVIKAIHLKLVENKIRDEVTIIASGGIAMAEHVPKAIIMGADIVAINIPIMLAVGCRLYENETPSKMIVFPDEFNDIPEETGMQRIVNLIGAWHSQILEVMGAMGIREVRRLRGETGRAIFFDEIDNESFGKIFKEHKEEK